MFRKNYVTNAPVNLSAYINFVIDFYNMPRNDLNLTVIYSDTIQGKRKLNGERTATT